MPSPDHKENSYPLHPCHVFSGIHVKLFHMLASLSTLCFSQRERQSSWNWYIAYFLLCILGLLSCLFLQPQSSSTPFTIRLLCSVHRLSFLARMWVSWAQGLCLKYPKYLEPYLTENTFCKWWEISRHRVPAAVPVAHCEPTHLTSF